jgi:hypothetical protein
MWVINAQENLILGSNYDFKGISVLTEGVKGN